MKSIVNFPVDLSYLGKITLQGFPGNKKVIEKLKKITRGSRMEKKGIIEPTGSCPVCKTLIWDGGKCPTCY